LENIRVSWKLTLIMAVLATGALGIFLSALTGLQTVQNYTANIYNFVLIPISNIDQAETALADIQGQLIALRNARLTPEEQSAKFQIINNAEKVFNATIDQYDTLWLTTLNPEFTQQLSNFGQQDLQKDEVTALAALHSAYATYVTNRQQFQAIQEKGLYESLSIEAASTAIVESRKHLRRLIEINLQFASLSNNTAQTAYQHALFTMSATLAVTTTLGLILAIVIARSITKRLGKVTQAARAMEQGTYNENVTLTITGNDEIGAMAVAFNTMATQLIQSLANLEERVAQRTAELQESSAQLGKRAKELESVSDISRSGASIQDLESLLPEVVSLISERFNFYHTGIFILNETRDTATLRAASSAGGQRLVDRQYSLKIDPSNLVGFAASRGLPKIARDISNHPDLPRTKSEIALPIMVGAQTIGVLDVHSTHANAFGEQEIILLGTLSNQIAVSIQNALSFGETRQALAESKKIYQQFVHQGWKRVASEATNLGYQYSQEGVHALNTALPASGNQNAMAIPIQSRGQTISVLNIRSDEPTHHWDEDEIALIQAAADRAALALENARLLEDSQRRAAKERTIGEISSKISASVNLDGILQTAAKELGIAIPDSEVIIQFQSPESK
jgi:GAF domain-containing protein/HAMP domain-containing protein